MTDVLLRRREGAVEYLTLNRPDRLNALNSALGHALADTLADIAGDETTRVVVLTGAGRGFCAGLDIIERSNGGDQTGIARLSEIVLSIRTMPQVVVAAVNGVAVGGGFAFALAADLRIAAESAEFRDGFIDIGVSGCELGLSALLPGTLGSALAAELILTGRPLTARRAYSAGFVTDVVAASELGNATERLVADLLAKSAVGLRRSKELLGRRPSAEALASVIDEEIQVQLSCMQHPDFADALARFSRRRR